MNHKHEKLNYVEFAANNLTATERFFESVFNWTFQHYGPDYSAFDHQGLDGGFYRADLKSRSDFGGALLVFYSAQLETTLSKIERNGGIIVKPIFDFPGGRRFHFTEPSGNEFSVWSDL